MDNNEFNEKVETKESNKTYLMYAITFVAVIIVATAAITYAYFTVATSENFSETTAEASLECINVSLSTTETISLSYNYPITDTLALTQGSITPVTVTLLNSCSESQIYSLTLSSLYLTGSQSSYIDDAKIRYAFYTSGIQTSGPDYLSNMTELSASTQAYKELTGTSTGAISTLFPSYTLNNAYALVTDATLTSGSSITYALYLWVDYYEGDSAMYDGGTTHDSSYDNSTEDMKFAAAISLTVG